MSNPFKSWPLADFSFASSISVLWGLIFSLLVYIHSKVSFSTDVQNATGNVEVVGILLTFIFFIFKVLCLTLCMMISPILNFRSKKLIQESDQHLKDIEKILQNDKRYLVLDCVPEERRKLIVSYVDDLDRRGPPPPPTASEPTRRTTK